MTKKEIWNTFHTNYSKKYLCNCCNNKFYKLIYISKRKYYTKYYGVLESDDYGCETIKCRMCEECFMKGEK